MTAKRIAYRIWRGAGYLWLTVLWLLTIESFCALMGWLEPPRLSQISLAAVCFGAALQATERQFSGLPKEKP